MNLLPSTFGATFGDTTYRLDARPVWLGLAAAAASLALLVALVVVARRRTGAIVSPFIPLLSLLFGGMSMFVFATRHLSWFGSDERNAAVVFRHPILYDAAAAGLGVGAAIAAILVVALRTEGQVQLLRYALPCAMLGFACIGAERHAESIAKVGSMPFYEVAGQHDVHVGRDRNVPVQLMRPPWHRFWGGMESGPQPIDRAWGWSGVEKVHVHSATSAGKIPFSAEARKGPVTLTTELSVNAVPEIASPLLSLRVGDRYTYRVRAKSSGGALLYFISLAGSESLHEVTVEVVGTRERDAFRTFVIEVRREDSIEQVEVVALAGETRFYFPAEEKVGEPVVAFLGDTVEPDPAACTFALLGAGSALCQRGGRDADVPAPPLPSSRGKQREAIARPPVAFQAAAPAAFTRTTSSSGGSTFATIFVAIVTVGLVILPDGSSASSYTLVATQRGPVGAPEALSH